MPRPMMPTQLTVLTSASASALKMSPVLNSIMLPFPNSTNRSLFRAQADGLYLASHSTRVGRCPANRRQRASSGGDLLVAGIVNGFVEIVILYQIVNGFDL